MQGKGQATEKEKMTLKGMRFLIADDNDLNAEILEELLKMEGADCDRAVNGKGSSRNVCKSGGRTI